MVDKPKGQPTDVLSVARLWSLTSEIGFKIAIPLIAFLLAGIWLDNTLGTKPLFMLLAIVLALASSAYLVYQIIRQVNQDGR